MDQVEEVVTALTRILPKPSTVPLIMMSTVLPDRVKALRKTLDEMGRTDLEIVEAPVSGAPLLAEAGRLSVMVGGQRDAFAKVKPILSAMGDEKKIFYLGALGNGSAMKLVNNIIGISVGLNVLEALTLGRKKGLDADTMARVINASSGKNFLTEQWPLTRKMFELLLQDTAYDAKSALFTTGIKDLETAKYWGALDNINIPCVENAIDQINNLNEEALVSTIKTVFGFNGTS